MLEIVETILAIVAIICLASIYVVGFIVGVRESKWVAKKKELEKLSYIAVVDLLKDIAVNTGEVSQQTSEKITAMETFETELKNRKNKNKEVKNEKD